METRRVSVCIGLALVLLAAARGAVDAQGQQAYASLWSAINSRPELTTFAQLLLAVPNNGALQSVLNQTGLLAPSVTGFLPSNSAFEQFAASQGLTLAALLATNDTSQLSRLLWYHFVPSVISVRAMVDSSSMAPSSYNTTTLLATYSTAKGSLLSPTPLLISASARDGSVSSVVVTSSTGATAKVLVADIQGGKGYINVVDNVMVFWYNTVAEVVQANVAIGGASPAAQFAQGLQQGGYWGLLNNASTTTSYTCFVPSQAAMDAAYANFGASILDAHLADIMSYHVIQGPAVLLMSTPNTQKTTSFSFALLRPTTQAEAITVSTFGTAPTTITSLGSVANVNYGAVAVGGIGARKSFIYTLNTVLMPVYTSVASYLISAPGYAETGGQLAALPNAAMPATPGQSATFLAPTGEAWQIFTTSAKYKYLTGNPALMSKVLQNHYIPGGIPLKTLLTDGSVSTYTTYGQSLLTVTSRLDTVIGTQFTGNILVAQASPQLTCNVAGVGPQNIPLLYNTSTVGILNISCVLVPYLPPSPPRLPPPPPPPGSADAATPSLPLLLGALLGLVLLRPFQML